jgi:transposase-like protein
LTRRGLRGVKLVIADVHEGLKAAVTKVLRATLQRCRVGRLNNLKAARAEAEWAKPVARRLATVATVASRPRRSRVLG